MSASKTENITEDFAFIKSRCYLSGKHKMQKEQLFAAPFAILLYEINCLENYDLHHLLASSAIVPLASSSSKAALNKSVYLKPFVNARAYGD